MRTEPVAYRPIYEHGDTCRFVGAEDVAKYGQGPHAVKSDAGDTVTLTVILEVTLPKDRVTISSRRPDWMDPGYVKYG